MSVAMIGFAGDPVIISVHTRSIAWLATIDWRGARRPSCIAPRPVIASLRCASASNAGADGNGMCSRHYLLPSTGAGRDRPQTSEGPQHSSRTQQLRFQRDRFRFRSARLGMATPVARGMIEGGPARHRVTVNDARLKAGCPDGLLYPRPHLLDIATIHRNYVPFTFSLAL
jgi:hypothetical protein